MRCFFPRKVIINSTVRYNTECWFFPQEDNLFFCSGVFGCSLVLDASPLAPVCLLMSTELSPGRFSLAPKTKGRGGDSNPRITTVVTSYGEYRSTNRVADSPKRVGRYFTVLLDFCNLCAGHRPAQYRQIGGVSSEKPVTALCPRTESIRATEVSSLELIGFCRLERDYSRIFLTLFIKYLLRVRKLLLSC